MAGLELIADPSSSSLGIRKLQVRLRSLVALNLVD